MQAELLRRGRKTLPIEYSPDGVHLRRMTRKSRNRQLRFRLLKSSGWTYRRIGKRYGLSYQRVQQLISSKVITVKKCFRCGSTGKICRHHTDYMTDEVEILCHKCHRSSHATRPKILRKKADYKWRDLILRMDKGDSFFLPNIQLSGVASYFWRTAERIGAKLTTRIEGSGVRVWRIK